VELWLRERQLSGATRVAVRCDAENDMVPTILTSLPRLRKQGIVARWGEAEPGIIVMELSSLVALLDAPRRRGTPAEPFEQLSDLDRLEQQTITLLHHLASESLRTLRVVPTESLLVAEMEQKLLAFRRVIPDPYDEEQLRAAVRTAIDAYESA
jgi:hypothetical protein